MKRQFLTGVLAIGTVAIGCLGQVHSAAASPSFTFGNGGVMLAQVNRGEREQEQERPRRVPTPALIPGLIGLGVAALRKKKQEEEVSPEA